MSARIFDAPIRERPPEWSPPTADLSPSTTDLHNERTTDLAPATLDMPQEADVAREARSLDVPAAKRPEPQTADASPAPATEHTMDAGVQKPAHQARQRPPAPGDVLSDRYLIEKVLGSGGTAVVYQARDMSSSTGAARCTRLALKVPRSEMDPERAAARLRHEFEHASKLSHPNVVHVLELHDHSSPCFMTMELIEGRPLSAMLRDWTMLPPPLAHKILRGCARALAHAHSHEVVHGDFKPANVFVTRDEEVRVVDFGAAAASSGGEESRIAAATPAYASPEVLSGERPERRDDVFSLACVAYELLTGQHPFERRSSLEAREAGRVPPRAWSLSANQWLALLSGLSWERARRPADVETLLAALTEDSEQPSEITPIHAAPGSVNHELPQELAPPRRSWGFFLFLACTLAVIVIATQRQGSESEPVANDTPATTSLPAGLLAAPSPGGGSALRELGKPAAPAGPGPMAATAPLASASDEAGSNLGADVAAPAPARAARPAAAMSEISFESAAVTTSEGSLAAVFLIKRSQPLNGRVRVSWRAKSGSADAGIDFASDASGTVEFADGQAQRAIFVPLRNDLIAEGDETFTVELHSPRQARLGRVASAVATIRDDDPGR